MMIHCNVTGSERKRMADVLGEYLRWEWRMWPESSPS